VFFKKIFLSFAWTPCTVQPKSDPVSAYDANNETNRYNKRKMFFQLSYLSRDYDPIICFDQDNPFCFVQHSFYRELEISISNNNWAWQLTLYISKQLQTTQSHYDESVSAVPVPIPGCWEHTNDCFVLAGVCVGIETGNIQTNGWNDVRVNHGRFRG
jgi:hypothetical protein